jgi:hypothetical protein
MELLRVSFGFYHKWARHTDYYYLRILCRMKVVPGPLALSHFRLVQSSFLPPSQARAVAVEEAPVVVEQQAVREAVSCCLQVEHLYSAVGLKKPWQFK